MNLFVAALLLAALPAAANLLGGLAAEAVPISQRTLSWALHAAAGVVLGVVAVELLPEALHQQPEWLIIVAFVAGGLSFIALDKAIDLVRARIGGETAAPTAIYAAVSIDLFSDGLMIGAGATIALGLALLLALGQSVADLPEGFATIVSFRRAGVPRRRRVTIAASFAAPILLGTVIGYTALREASEFARYAVLAFTAGILLTAVVEEIVPQAHADTECGTDARVPTLFLIGGFALFSLLATTLGTR
jgi:zinc transporter, ZIP family